MSSAPNRPPSTIARTGRSPRRRAPAGALLALALALGWPVAGHAADYLAAGQRLMAAGDLRGAQLELRNALRQHPRDGAVHFALGQVDFALGDAVGAEVQARAARDGGYHPGPATTLLLRAYLAQGRLVALLKDFPVPQKTPDLTARVDVGRGLALLALGRTAEGAAAIAAARKLAPNAVGPLLAASDLAAAKGDAAGALKLADEALSRRPGSVRAMIRKGRLLAATGHARQAVAVLDKAVAAAPGNYTARLSRASALIAAGEDARAAADVKATLAAIPGNAEAIYLHAVLRAHRGDYKGANAALEKLSPVLARFPSAYLLQAIVFGHLGQLARAEDAARHYVARVPGDPRGLRILAGLEVQANQPHRALARLKALHAAGQKDAGLYDLFGRAYMEAGAPGPAVASYRRATALAPKDGALRARLGAARLRLGDAAGAARDLHQALVLAPKLAGVRQLLALAAIDSGQFALAGQTLATLKAHHPADPGVGNLEGLLHLAQFDLAGARAAFETVHKAHPDFIPATQNLAKVAALEGNPAEAQTLWRSILAHHPAEHAAVGALVGSLTAEGKTAAAIAVLQRAHTAAPQDASLTVSLAEALIHAKKATQALDLLNQAAAGHAPVGTIVAARVDAELALGQTADARDSLRQLIAIAPAAVPLRLRLAQMLADAKHYGRARAVLQDGLKRSPGNFVLLQALVGLALREGGPARASAEVAKLAADPANLPGASALPGDLLMAEKKFPEAAAAYRAALAEHPLAPLVLREASALGAAGQPAAARAAMAAWLKTHPDDPAVAGPLASVEIAAHRLGAARRLLEAVVAKQPDDGAALNNLAWIYQQEGDKRAAALAERAYRLVPGPNTADTLGWILAGSGQHAMALALLRQAHAGLPGDPAITYHLASTLAATGKTPAAVALLKPLVAAPQSFPDKSKAAALLARLGGK